MTRKKPSAPLKLLLAVEYSAATPISMAGGQMTDLTPLGLDPDLVDALLTWQRHFSAHFSIQCWDWDSPQAAAWHREAGAELHERMKSALPDAEIELILMSPEDDPPANV